VLLAALSAVLLVAQGRVRPPQGVGCDRNHLTVYPGEVVEYSRSAAAMRLRVKTEFDTDETFTLHFAKATPAESFMLLDGAKFAAADWPKVESARGKLLPGVKVAVWQCEGAANPVVDWRLPPK